MNLSELVAEVTELVKRPDLSSRITSAVKAATLKAHHSDFYYKDLRESGVSFDGARYVQNFNPTQIFSNYRKIKYLRYWNDGDPSGLGAGLFLTPVSIESARDIYGVDRTDVYYLAGELVQIRLSCPWDKFLFGAYIHPTVTADCWESWISAEYPWAIIYEAARSVFQGIGLQEQSADMRLQVAEQYQTLKVNSIGLPGE